MGWQGLITAGILTFISVFLVRLWASACLLSLLSSLPALITIVLSVLPVPLVERQRNQVRLVTLTRIATRGCSLLIALAQFVLVGAAQRWVPLTTVLLW